MHFCLVKHSKIINIHIKWLPDGSWEAFGASYFFLVASWTPLAGIGERPGTKAAPEEPLGRQRGSKTPSQEVKSRSGELQNDICMLISSPSLNFNVFSNLGGSKLQQRNRLKKYRKNALNKHRRLCLHRSADMHNVL